MKCKIYKPANKKNIYLLIPVDSNINDIEDKVRSHFGEFKEVAEIEIEEIYKIFGTNNIEGVAKEEITDNIEKHGYHILELSDDQLSILGTIIGAGILGITAFGPLGIVGGIGALAYYFLKNENTWEGKDDE